MNLTLSSTVGTSDSSPYEFQVTPRVLLTPCVVPLPLVGVLICAVVEGAPAVVVVGPPRTRKSGQ